MKEDVQIEAAAAEIVAAACQQQRMREHVVHGQCAPSELLEAERALARATYRYRKLQGDAK